MNMKQLIALTLSFGLALSAFCQGTAINRGKLQSNLDGGGNSITNASELSSASDLLVSAKGARGTLKLQATDDAGYIEMRIGGNPKLTIQDAGPVLSGISQFAWGDRNFAGYGLLSRGPSGLVEQLNTIGGSMIADSTINSNKLDAAARALFASGGLGFTPLTKVESTNMVNGIIKTNARPYGVVSVADYGATGANNFAGPDDGPAFQNAINAAVSSGLYKVWIPPGTYTIKSTVDLPVGGLSYGYRFEMFGSGQHKDVVIKTDLTNAPVFRALCDDNLQGSYLLKGFFLYGPARQVNNPIYANTAAWPFGRRGLIELGKSRTVTSQRSGLSVFDTIIEDLDIRGGAYGICITNGQSILMKDCNVWENGLGNVVWSHVDTSKIQGGNFGYLLVTNRTERLYSFYFDGTPNSPFNSPAYYLGGADSGAHKIIEGIEHSGPFLYADSARFTVIGGQFESGGHAYGNGWDIYTPLELGFCYLTNIGQYNFIGSSFNLQRFEADANRKNSTNTVLFYCAGNASAGLKLMGCSTAGGFNDAANSQYAHKLFRIDADAQYDYSGLFHPYWNMGMIGSSPVGQSQAYPNFLNTIYVRRSFPIGTGKEEFGSSYSTFPYNSWTATGTWAVSNAVPTYTADINYGFCSGGAYANWAGTATNEFLTSPAFSTTGLTNLVVMFTVGKTNYTGTIVVEMYDGTSWANIGAVDANTLNPSLVDASIQTMSIPATYNGRASAQLRFRAGVAGGGGAIIKIDDVMLYGDQAAQLIHIPPCGWGDIPYAKVSFYNTIYQGITNTYADIKGGFALGNTMKTWDNGGGVQNDTQNGYATWTYQGVPKFGITPTLNTSSNDLVVAPGTKKFIGNGGGLTNLPPNPVTNFYPFVPGYTTAGNGVVFQNSDFALDAYAWAGQINADYTISVPCGYGYRTNIFRLVGVQTNMTTQQTAAYTIYYRVRPAPGFPAAAELSTTLDVPANANVSRLDSFALSWWQYASGTAAQTNMWISLRIRNTGVTGKYGVYGLQVENYP